jgi:hypothetical protein
MAKHTKTPAQERAAGARWAQQLPLHLVYQFVDAAVLGELDWRDWFDARPSRAFLAGAFDAAQHREETDGGLGATRTETQLDEVVAALMAWGLTEGRARQTLQREKNVAKFVLMMGGGASAAADAVMYRAHPEVARDRARFFRARRA